MQPPCVRRVTTGSRLDGWCPWCRHADILHAGTEMCLACQMEAAANMQRVLQLIADAIGGRALELRADSAGYVYCNKPHSNAPWHTIPGADAEEAPQPEVSHVYELWCRKCGGWMGTVEDKSKLAQHTEETGHTTAWRDTAGWTPE